MYTMRSTLLSTLILLVRSTEVMASLPHQVASLHRSLHTRRWAQPRSLTDPLVFAHYMITFQPPNGDYTPDIKAAKDAGIDAFAVNYGGWGVDKDTLALQLDRFYTNASAMNFKIFLSYDTMVMSDPTVMVNLSNVYKHHPAQLWIDDKLFLSSFSVGDPPFNWQHDVLDKIDAPVMFMPASISEDANVTAKANIGSGPMTWIHPASTPAHEAAIDLNFSNKRSDGSKPWMAGLAPWFFKRMSYDENWLHAQDGAMWLDRWLHLLQLRPNFIELITWNDYGESTYIGPTTSFHLNKQAQVDCFYGGLPHTAFLSMAKIFIRAYKSGQAGPINIAPEEEDVFMFHRLQPALTLGRTDTLPLPKNASDLPDVVHIISFLSAPAAIWLEGGGLTKQLNAPAGISNFSVPWNLGNQTITMDRLLGGTRRLGKTGPAIQAQLDKYQGNVVAM